MDDKFWWGYVTDTSPLLIGREASTPAAQSVRASGCLVAGLVVGDRVLVHLAGTAATVLGKNHTY